MSVAATIPIWHEANQRYLTAALAELRAALEGYASRGDDGASDASVSGSAPGDSQTEIAATMPRPAALDRLCQAFGLSSFERDVLLLCAGVELDASFAAVCAAAHDNPGCPYPTFGLALAARPGAHWSALTPAAPLRHWRLIDLDTAAGLTTGRLRIDERVLHFLTGTPHLDESLVGFVAPMLPFAGTLAPSQAKLARQITRAWSQAVDGDVLPAVQLCGVAAAEKRAVAAAACAQLGLPLHVMPAQVLPSGPHEFEILLRLWAREWLLGAGALLVDAEAGGLDESREHLLCRFVEEANGPLLIATREGLRLRHRPSAIIEVNKLARSEQHALWQQSLGPRAAAFNGQVDRITAQFDLGEPAIRAACVQALSPAEDENGSDALERRLWETCRAQARRKLGRLARRIEPAATWDDLVLPEPQLGTLREIAVHVRQRIRVHETWGFAHKSARGLGITALFTGPSGTGKTLAAEVLAHALGLDLYHLDLSQAVSKYIGETEKNLARVFDAAEAGGAVLLFDEADALFGKRSEVKDSHDRYANIEVSYLLQRMETYRGLAILTTNLKNALDEAFQRRIRFVASFPFPDAHQRAEIWRRIFPAETPTQGLDAEKLARLNATGGTIRNVALHAAFRAADADAPVQMKHVLDAAQRVSARLDKPLSDRETRGWT